MSIFVVVFVSRQPLPEPAEWSVAAGRAGVDLRFPEPFGWESQSGGLPVVCDGVRAGFELYANTMREHFADLESPPSWRYRLRLRRYRVAVDFVTHSRSDDRFAAVMAAATLAEATSGLLWDEPSGRYVPGSDAVAWARGAVVPPSVEDLARRDRTLEAVQGFVASELAPYGYRPVDLDRSSLPEVSWYYRAGKTFTTELAEVTVSADGAKSFLLVCFVGSHLSLEELRIEGLEGNAAGRYLNQLYTHEDYLSDDPPLPQSIPVDETFPESVEAERLRLELREADERIFDRLA